MNCMFAVQNCWLFYDLRLPSPIYLHLFFSSFSIFVFHTFHLVISLIIRTYASNDFIPPFPNTKKYTRIGIISCYCAYYASYCIHSFFDFYRMEGNSPLLPVSGGNLGKLQQMMEGEGWSVCYAREKYSGKSLFTQI